MNTAIEEIEKIRTVRRSISAACGNDPLRLVLHYIARAKQRGEQCEKPSTAAHPKKVAKKA